MPWHQYVFAGWLAEYFLCMIIVVAYFVVMSSFLSFFITVCLYHRGFLQIFSNYIDDVDKCNNNSRPDSFELKRRFRDAIQFHTSAMR